MGECIRYARTNTSQENYNLNFDQTQFHILYNITRCKKPRVANCVRARTCRYSAARALVTRGRCANLLKLTWLWQEKDV